MLASVPIKLLLVLVQHIQPLVLRLLVDVVVGVLLDVGVDNGDKLTPMCCQTLLHLDRVRKGVFIPSKVPDKQQDQLKVSVLSDVPVKVRVLQ